MDQPIVSRQTCSWIVETKIIVANANCAVGSDREVRPLTGSATRVIDLGGRTVVPGLIDSNIHATLAGLSWDAELHWERIRTLSDGIGQIAMADGRGGIAHGASSRKAEPRQRCSRHQDLVARAGKAGGQWRRRRNASRAANPANLRELRTRHGTRARSFAYTRAMSRLDSAMSRFAASLDKLEAALAKREVSAKFDETLVLELAGLKEDRARLAAELARLHGEKVALEGFTDEVAGRLEGAIREIRAVLSH